MGPEMKVPAEADEWNSCAMGIDESRLGLAESTMCARNPGDDGRCRANALGFSMEAMTRSVALQWGQSSIGPRWDQFQRRASSVASRRPAQGKRRNGLVGVVMPGDGRWRSTICCWIDPMRRRISWARTTSASSASDIASRIRVDVLHFRGKLHFVRSPMQDCHVVAALEQPLHDQSAGRPCSADHQRLQVNTDLFDGQSIGASNAFGRHTANR